MRSVTTLLAREDATAMNEFVLTSSVYLRCCEVGVGGCREA